jgi:hypothetical protein
MLVFQLAVHACECLFCIAGSGCWERTQLGGHREKKKHNKSDDSITLCFPGGLVRNNYGVAMFRDGADYNNPWDKEQHL